MTKDHLNATTEQMAEMVQSNIFAFIRAMDGMESVNAQKLLELAPFPEYAQTSLEIMLRAGIAEPEEDLHDPRNKLQDRASH